MSVPDLLLIGVCAALGFGIVWHFLSSREQ